MEGSLGQDMGQLKHFSKGAHERGVPLPLPVSHYYLSPEPRETPSLTAVSLALLYTLLGPLTDSHTLKPLDYCPLPWGLPPITEATQETDAVFWSFPE